MEIPSEVQLTSKEADYFARLNKLIEERTEKLNIRLKENMDFLKESKETRADFNRQLMLLYNKHLPKDTKIGYEETSRLIELMDRNKAVAASYYLREQGSLGALQFMEEFIPVYESSTETKHVSNAIKDAINEIKKRSEKRY